MRPAKSKHLVLRSLVLSYPVQYTSTKNKQSRTLDTYQSLYAEDLLGIISIPDYKLNSY
jgi:hypothetical protein